MGTAFASVPDRRVGGPAPAMVLGMMLTLGMGPASALAQQAPMTPQPPPPQQPAPPAAPTNPIAIRALEQISVTQQAGLRRMQAIAAKGIARVTRQRDAYVDEETLIRITQPMLDQVSAAYSAAVNRMAGFERRGLARLSGGASGVENAEGLKAAADAQFDALRNQRDTLVEQIIALRTPRDNPFAPDDRTEEPEMPSNPGAGGR